MSPFGGFGRSKAKWLIKGLAMASVTLVIIALSLRKDDLRHYEHDRQGMYWELFK